MSKITVRRAIELGVMMMLLATVAISSQMDQAAAVAHVSAVAAVNL